MEKAGGWKWKAAFAIAAALAAGTAQAQSSVTLYGILDIGLAYASKTAGSNGQNTGKSFSLMDGAVVPSLWGIKGTEDLGGGLKANFEIESGINVANGGLNNSNGNVFGRQTWVALDGGFGELKLGLQYSPFFLVIYGSDPRGLTCFGSSVVPYGDSVALTAAFSANAVSYTSPKIAGFQGSVLIALGGVGGDFQAGRVYSGSLTYTNGDLSVLAAYYNGNSGGTGQTPVPTTVEFNGRTIGISYKYGPVTGRASVVNYQVAGGFNNYVYGGGLDYQVSPFVDLNGGVWFTSDRNDTKNHSVLAGFGAQYFISRRTSLYSQIEVVNNQGAMNTGLSVSDPALLFGAPGTTVGVDIGIQHMF
jgi:predicted porin